MLLKKYYLMLGFLLVFFAAMAQSYESQKVEQGVVDSINLEASTLVVNDSVLKIPLNVKVFDRRGSLVNRYSLKESQSIKFSREYRGGDFSDVTTIWIQ